MVALGLAVVFAALTAWVASVGEVPGDALVARWLTAHVLPAEIRTLAHFFADLGTPTIAVASVLISAALLGRRLGSRVACAVGGTLIVAGLSYALKEVVGPTTFYAELGREGNNYPSGHAAFGVAFYGLWASLALTWGFGDVAGVVGAIAVFIGAAQVLNGAHIPSDVVAGYALGGFWLALTLSLDTRITPRTPLGASGQHP
jgi:undecaprenyl-diphosphatase